MYHIGARARDGIHHTAGCAAITRVVVVRQQRELLDSICTKRKPEHTTRNAVRVVVLADSVEKVVVLRGTPATDTHRRSKTATTAIGRAAIEGILCTDRRYTGLKQC